MKIEVLMQKFEDVILNYLLLNLHDNEYNPNIYF